MLKDMIKLKLFHMNFMCLDDLLMPIVVAYSPGDDLLK